MMLRFERYQPELADALRAVFHSAIHLSAAPWYSAAERAAWSPEHYDRDAWADNLARIIPWLVWDGDELVGYGDVQLDGYIDHFYVSGTAARRGIGQTLFNHLLEQAQANGAARLTSDVSLSAEGFFAKQGFTVQWRRVVRRGGVALRNARMSRQLDPYR